MDQCVKAIFEFTLFPNRFNPFIASRAAFTIPTELKKIKIKHHEDTKEVYNDV